MMSPDIIDRYLEKMDGFYKGKVRDYLAPPKPFSSGLLLPGKQCIDAKQYDNMGLIKPKGRLGWFEELDGTGRKRDFVTPINETLDSLGLDHYHIAGRLEDSILMEPVDYANIDLTGPITDDLTFWVNDQLVPNLLPKATVGFTYRYNGRNTKSIAEAKSFITRNKEFKACFEAMCGSTRIWKRETWTTQLFMLFCSLNRFTFSNLYQIKYKDSRTPMCVSKFTDLKLLPNGKTNGFPSINQLFSRRIPMKSKATQKKQSDAGYKAWETRRANEKKATQKAAGFKAWETRRYNELKAKQSEAGRKAWATRRANQELQGS